MKKLQLSRGSLRDDTSNVVSNPSQRKSLGMPTETNDESMKLFSDLVKAEIAAPLNEKATIFLDENEEPISFQSFPLHIRTFFKENVSISTDAAFDLCAQTVKQTGSLWVKERRVRITACSAYELYTYYSGTKNDWDRKAALHVSSSFKGNAATEHGIKEEPIARSVYCQAMGKRVLKVGLLVNSSVPWIGCSLDGVVPDECTIEIKCPVIGQTCNISDVLPKLPYLKCVNGQYTLKVKHKFYCQVQLGMFLSNYNLCHFIVYSSFNSSFCVIEVPYDERTVFDYLSVLTKVYFRYLLPKLAELL